VATALLRKAWTHAVAIDVLAHTSVPEASIPNLRSLLEAFGELHFLLSSPVPLDSARLAYLFALREIHNFQQKWGDDPSELKRLSTELQAKRDALPHVAELLDACRHYWTSQSRTDLIEAALSEATRRHGTASYTDLGRQVYKLLSWDDHHVMATLLTIDLAPESPTSGRIKSQDAPFEAAEFIPFLAANLLDDMRQQYEDGITDADA
jgi:hypothetical protein